MPRHPWAAAGLSHFLLTMMLLSVQFRWVLLWTVCLVSHAVSQTTEMRVPNGTLAVPQEPSASAIALENAFGDAINLGYPAVVITAAPSETNRLFIAHQTGEVFVLPSLHSPIVASFLSVRSRVAWGGEAGLLGLAFHPGYATNRLFYLFYTASVPQDNGVLMEDRLSRFQGSPEDPDRALPDSEQILFSQPDFNYNHNAGDLHFGPDGYLYVSLGDGGGNGDIVNAQRINKDFFSGILRIDVDKRPGSLEPNPHHAVWTNLQGEAYYSVPPDNPFIGTTNFNGQPIDPATVRTEFWAVGFRNPWRMSFDSLNGKLYAGDVGGGKAEEVNLVVRGGNYGWPYLEGTNVFYPPIGFESVMPICSIPWGSGDEQARSVIGGVVYRGSRMPELYGSYVFADFTGGKIGKLTPDGTNPVPFELLTTGTQASAFGLDPRNGDILMTAYLEGKIKRLTHRDGTNAARLPYTLAETGVFRDLASLEAETGILPYEINVPFWSDHARKRRWFSIPDTNQAMTWSASGNWLFPTGTVWIKHFDLELTNGIPESARRLETRFLVKNAEGVHGFTYRWNAAQTDADLVGSGGQDETIPVYRPDGSLLRNQTWRYPGRSECLQCHTPQGGYALGFNTVQLNRAHDFGIGPTNQIAQLSRMGYFDGPTPDPETLPRLAPASDVSASLEHRARSYLQANCVQCHQPGGVARGIWDARIATPMVEAGILNGPLVSNYGDTANRVVRPGSLDQSMLFRRVSQPGPGHMPPLGTSELNEEAIELLRQWITSGVGSVTVTWAGSGPLHLSYSGEPGRAYRIEASTDLVQWQPVATVVATATGAVEYSAESGSERARFYRVVWP